MPIGITDCPFVHIPVGIVQPLRLAMAIARYGMRVVPDVRQIIEECRRQAQLVEGPDIELFEDDFVAFLGSGHVRACSTDYGRMALYFILRALELPPRSEVIVPALTFWVVPEIVRVAGLTPVFADVDPGTFTMSPRSVASLLSPGTSAILPTHLYGLPCDMDPILDLARRHRLKVIEDCAHSLGATYKGRMTGTLGDASFFSFQAFKPLNTFGGGLAWTRDAEVARRVAALADDEPQPTVQRVERLLRVGRWQHRVITPRCFTWSLFPIWFAASFTNSKPEQRLWERIESLDPLPTGYRGRFSNVQAAIGRAGLARLPEFIARTRRHAARLDALFSDVPGLITPTTPQDRTHVYYQYCAYVPDPQTVVRGCIRRGVDVAPLHVNVCTRMPLFNWTGAKASGAERAATAIQVPIYESLSDAQVERIGQLVRARVERLGPETRRAHEQWS